MRTDVVRAIIVAVAAVAAVVVVLVTLERRDTAAVVVVVIAPGSPVVAPAAVPQKISWSQAPLSWLVYTRTHSKVVLHEAQ